MGDVVHPQAERERYPWIVTHALDWTVQAEM
jgi:hypothetical protein